MLQPYDLPLEELRTYRPPLTRAADFDEYWAEAKRAAGAVPLDVRLAPAEYPAGGVRVFELSYSGTDGSRIRGYLAHPDDGRRHPGLVVYHGYNYCADGNLHDLVNWALHGYATFGMQTRGQYGSGDALADAGGHVAGWMTKGILDERSYYYRAVYMDAVRALDVLAGLDAVDPGRIGVTGGSQGGGLSLAAAALSDIPRACAADYPYLCHFRRAIDLAPAGPYGELNEFFRRHSDPAVEETALRTLSYCDVMNLAGWIRCPVLVSSGLIDQITPPSTVFAAFHHVGSADKEICVYRYFGHEFIPAFQTERLRFLRKHLQAEE